MIACRFFVCRDAACRTMGERGVSHDGSLTKAASEFEGLRMLTPARWASMVGLALALVALSLHHHFHVAELTAHARTLRREADRIHQAQINSSARADALNAKRVELGAVLRQMRRNGTLAAQEKDTALQSVRKEREELETALQLLRKEHRNKTLATQELDMTLQAVRKERGRLHTKLSLKERADASTHKEIKTLQARAQALRASLHEQNASYSSRLARLHADLRVARAQLATAREKMRAGLVAALESVDAAAAHNGGMLESAFGERSASPPPSARERAWERGESTDESTRTAAASQEPQLLAPWSSPPQPRPRPLAASSSKKDKHSSYADQQLGLKRNCTVATGKQLRTLPQASSRSRARSTPSRTIWLWWAQGWHRAPPIAIACALSWERANPSWRVIRLSYSDLTNLYPEVHRALGTYANLPYKEHPQYSDLLRTELLGLYGGLWTDSTIFCVRPVDDRGSHHAQPAVLENAMSFERHPESRALCVLVQVDEWMEATLNGTGGDFFGVRYHDNGPNEVASRASPTMPTGASQVLLQCVDID